MDRCTTNAESSTRADNDPGRNGLDYHCCQRDQEAGNDQPKVVVEQTPPSFTAMAVSEIPWVDIYSDVEMVDWPAVHDQIQAGQVVMIENVAEETLYAWAEAAHAHLGHVNIDIYHAARSKRMYILPKGVGPSLEHWQPERMRLWSQHA